MGVEVYRFDGTSLVPHLFTNATLHPKNDRNNIDYGAPGTKPVLGVTAGLVNPNANFETIGDGVSTIQHNVAGAVFVNKIFNGKVVISALGISYFNCIFLGPSNVTNASGSAQACVTGSSSAPTFGMLGGAHFVDSLFAPQTNTWWTYAIDRSWFTLERCEVKHSVDGLSLGSPSDASQPTRVLGSYIHDSLYFSWDPAVTSGDGHSDGQTHSDGAQVARGKYIEFRGSYIGGVPSVTTDLGDGSDFPNSCIIIGQGGASPTDPANTIDRVIVTLNWFEGSVCNVNLVRAFGNALAGVEVTNNRFARRTSGYYIAQPIQPYFMGIVSGNVHEDDGSPVPITRGANGS